MDVKEAVIGVLKSHPDGVTITNISKALGVTRHTVSLKLAELKGGNTVEIRQVGMAKLHYWRGDR